MLWGAKDDVKNLRFSGPSFMEQWVLIDSGCGKKIGIAVFDFVEVVLDLSS